MSDQTPQPWTPLLVLRSAFYLGGPHTPNGLLKRIEALGYTIVPAEAAQPAPLDERYRALVEAAQAIVTKVAPYGLGRGEMVGVRTGLLLDLADALAALEDSE